MNPDDAASADGPARSDDAAEDPHALAARQHGLLTRSQLAASGLGVDALWRKVKRGELEVAVPGVYRLPGAPRTWEQRVMTAVVWAGAATVSHRSAARLWGLDGFDGEGVEITTAKRCRLEKPGFKVYQATVPERMMQVREFIPVTRPPRTLVDLAPLLKAEPYERVVEDALRAGLISVPALQAYVKREGGSGHRGIGILRELLEEGELQQGPSASAFQRRVRRLLQRVGGFREEYEVLDGAGKFVERADFGHEVWPVLVEAESRKHHSGRADWFHDLERRNKVTALGYRVLHATARDLQSVALQAAFVAQVRSTLFSVSGGRSQTR